MRSALITGVSGQDGSYLAELLLAKNYAVHGTIRPSKNSHKTSIPEFQNKVGLYPLDVRDGDACTELLTAIQPDEVYHLAARSDVQSSIEWPLETFEVNVIGTLNLLKACRDLTIPPRFFHASSSQVFGRPDREPQDESTPFRPVNPYGIAKAAAANMVGFHREANGLFAVNGILFNHESPRRGDGFVTAKICRGAVAISRGLQSELVLGDLTAWRDWGHALDYVEGFWQSLQCNSAEDFVFATGEPHQVQEIVEIAFQIVNLDWKKYVRSDPAFFRPAEAKRLVGNSEKASRLLQWKPRISFRSLIEEMTRAALALPPMPAVTPVENTPPR